MNDIKQYFTSPTKAVAAAAPSNALQPIKSESNPNAGTVKAAVSSSVLDNQSVPNSPSSACNKLIVSNMSSVISSVEKLHKAKRKEKELKRKKREAEPEINIIADILSNGLHFVSPNVSLGGNDEAATAEQVADDNDQEVQPVSATGISGDKSKGKH